MKWNEKNDISILKLPSFNAYKSIVRFTDLIKYTFLPAWNTGPVKILSLSSQFLWERFLCF
jgi:hypothetical protein